MHLFKQHVVKDSEAVSRLIPAIDCGPYFAGEPGALEAPTICRDLVLEFHRKNYFHQKGHESEAVKHVGAA